MHFIGEGMYCGPKIRTIACWSYDFHEFAFANVYIFIVYVKNSDKFKE